MIAGLTDLLEREAGHIIVASLLLTGAVTADAYGIPSGKEVAAFALGVLARSMNGNGNGKNHPEPPKPTA